MYSEKFQKSLAAVEAAREANIAYEPARMTAKEKEDLLAAYHPDYKKANLQHSKSVQTRVKKFLTSFAKCFRLTAVFPHPTLTFQT